MLAEYIGRSFAGFKNGSVYKIRYEYVGSVLFITTPKMKLSIAYDQMRFVRRDWKIIKR